MTLNCYKCKIVCTLREPKNKEETFGAVCDSCRRVLCKTCSEISPTEIRAATLTAKVLKFFCPDCFENIGNLPKLRCQVQELRDEVESLKIMLRSFQEKPSFAEVVKGVTRENQEMRAEIAGLKEVVSKSDMREKLEVARGDTQQLMGEIQKLKEATTTRVGVNGSDLPVEPAVQEMMEREARASNLLVFGVRESDGENREQRTKNEKETVRKIIGTVCRGFETMNLKIFRIGKYAEGKPRPVKIVFPSKEEALQVFKLRRNLPDKEGVYIKRDQTQNQRLYLKQVLAELEDRKKKGQQDLTIRYINSVPKIMRFKRKPDTEASKN